MERNKCPKNSSEKFSPEDIKENEKKLIKRELQIHDVDGTIIFTSKQYTDEFEKNVTQLVYDQIKRNIRKSQVKVAPGYKTINFLRIFCSKKFVDRELEQIHSDAIHELYEAEKNGNKILAFTIPWRLRAHLLGAVLMGIMGGFLSKFRFGLNSSKD
ncbi:MAG: hypothetical protein E2581_17325 [Pseudomonas sp.]|uniref:hypothetical protein n=1 Tax=Pseudomonas sp. TaxID=306 RepID=UPI001DC32B3C|nr:hypothetical protein [Pseudomonas sp.]MPT00244.1 hypothetical protein [Pseudomonas sp.]